MVGVTISVAPTFISHGGPVKISISNDGSSVLPSNSDWVACYSPANSDISSTTPIRYQFANWTGTWGNNSLPATTTLTFRLNNLHYDYACYLFTGGLKATPTLPFSKAYAANPQYTGVPAFPKPFTSIVGSAPAFRLLAGPSDPIVFDIPDLPTHVRVTPASCPAAAAGTASAGLCFNFAWNQAPPPARTHTLARARCCCPACRGWARFGMACTAAAAGGVAAAASPPQPPPPPPPQQQHKEK